MDEREARRAYLDRLDDVLATDFLQPFDAVMDAYRLDAFGVLVLESSARRTIRTAARIAEDRYEAINVQYVARGAASGNANGRTVTSLPGTVMILDYGQPFTITDHERRDVINIALPRASFPTRNATAWHGAILEGATATMLARFMATLAETLSLLPADSAAGMEQAFVALLTAAVGGAIGGAKAGAPGGADARLIQRAGQLVDDRIASPELDPAWLAGKLNVSRSELYSVMERFGGVSRFILQRRLARARTALEDTSDQRRIGAIAFAFGFASEAHFARAFRAAFGTTASAVRRATSAKPDAPHAKSGTDSQEI
ncbi:helix-turn-helix domain-containing protein [Sphingomonas sp. HHU CXW]|uniref:Helix-turn-helix domain-containing protein n=1 Tax=Sphingomonas hominis TaxID=2741495 RepID=A0ABX2JM07_9SPHN|nr:helix-turn-helix domain-containing protein [Sphingomonas hominis]NTS66849.1 helix-turn-helix domain-containing protein [Sphingomonas hominis]